MGLSAGLLSLFLASPAIMLFFLRAGASVSSASYFCAIWFSDWARKYWVCWDGGLVVRRRRSCSGWLWRSCVLCVQWWSGFPPCPPRRSSCRWNWPCSFLDDGCGTSEPQEVGRDVALLHLLLHQIHRELLYIFNIIFIAAANYPQKDTHSQRERKDRIKMKCFIFICRWKQGWKWSIRSENDSFIDISDVSYILCGVSFVA